MSDDLFIRGEGVYARVVFNDDGYTAEEARELGCELIEMAGKVDELVREDRGRREAEQILKQQLQFREQLREANAKKFRDAYDLD